ncbi:hypothetical protein ACR78F_11890 [Sphingobacterium spiritivorum]|uniref:hypothetical protein n=1 Tax=Sphingobacterium spiritivorum TaxID=258 RepID=UPI003DA2548A
MNLPAFIRQFYQIQSCYGITYAREGDQVRLEYCRLQLEKDTLNIAETGMAAGWQELSKKLEPKLPIALQVGGKQVLVKEVNYTSEIGTAEILEIFPNFSEESFYYSVHKGQHMSWIALVRRNVIDQLIEEITASGNTVVQLYIGPFVYNAVLSQINKYNGHYIVDGHTIQIDKETKEWLSYSYSRDAIEKYTTKIGTQVIDQRFLGAYAAGFSCLMYDYLEEDHAVSVNSVHSDYIELREKIRFNKNLLLITGILFTLLALNAVVFSYYYGRNQELESQVTAQQSTVTDINKLQKRIEVQEQQIKALGWNGGVPKSWLLDQIGQSLQGFSAIIISGIAINPASDSKNEIKDINLSQRILIKGQCLSLSQLNAWIRHLERKGWIEKVSIEQFGAGQDQVQDPLFTLQIQFNDHVE